MEYPEKYKGTEYVDFAADLAIALLDYWKFDENNKNTTYFNFMTYVGEAFVNEWERLRNEKETQKKTAG